MANYMRDGATRLSDATARSYGALKAQLQRAGTPTHQHNVDVKKSAPKPAKKAAAKKTAPAKKATAKAEPKTTAKKAAKKPAKKAAAKKP